MEINEFELFKHTSKMRNSIIQNIDNQVLKTKEIFLGIVTLLIGSSITLKNISLILLSSVLTIVFWVVEATLKKNQRNYIFLNNLIQKKLSYAKGKKERKKIIVKYSFDLNGYYSCWKDKDEDLKNRYIKETSFNHTLFMKNVSVFYLSLFIIQICIFISVILFKIKFV